MRPRALIWIFATIAVVATARRWLDIVEVRGRSMAPTLLPGDRLLVARARPRAGDVVLAPDPRMDTRELIKRVATVTPESVVLRGDNSVASTNATVAADRVRWRAILRYWPPARATPRLATARPIDDVLEGGEPACSMPEALIAGIEASRT
jgi:signal peptidase I